jgi:hypothetical protein
MDIPHLHKSGGRFLQEVIKSTSVLLVLFVYLIIPFKQQFLDTIHLASHVMLYDEPQHAHDHGNAEANHHHEYLAFLNDALNNHDTAHPIPVELVNYQFETPFPSIGLHLAEYLPLLIKQTFHTLFIPVLTGPSFDVPLPPP